MEKNAGNHSHTDPRGCGFRTRVAVDQLQALIESAIAPLGSEVVAVSESLGRILQSSVFAQKPIPPFARAAMDGYAIIATDSFGADFYTPSVLQIIGRSRPGSGFSGCISTGQAVAIATGAPIPDGADCVIPVEMTELKFNRVYLRESVPPGRNVGHIGEDVKPGDCILPAGRSLRPQDIGLLSGLGINSIEVIIKPVIAIVITGDELVPAFETSGTHKITDMNSPMLRSLVERDGGNAIIVGPLVDDYQLLESTLKTLSESDNVHAIFVNGGSSTGPEDFAPLIVQKLGVLMAHGVALRPSSPTGFGFINHKPVLLIPGNPVSSLCAYDFFGCNIVRRLGGRRLGWTYPKIRGILSQKVTSSLGRLDYVRVKQNETEGNFIPIASGGASILSGTTQAFGFMIVPADLEGYPAGTEIEIYCYDNA